MSNVNQNEYYWDDMEYIFDKMCDEDVYFTEENDENIITEENDENIITEENDENIITEENKPKKTQVTEQEIDAVYQEFLNLVQQDKCMIEKKQAEYTAWRKQFPKAIRTLQSFDVMYEEMKKEKAAYFDKQRLEIEAQRNAERIASKRTVTGVVKVPWKPRTNYNKQKEKSLVIDEEYKKLQTQRAHARKEKRKEEKKKEVVTIVAKPVLVSQEALIEDVEQEVEEVEEVMPIVAEYTPLVLKAEPKENKVVTKVEPKVVQVEPNVSPKVEVKVDPKDEWTTVQHKPKVVQVAPVSKVAPVARFQVAGPVEKTRMCRSYTEKTRCPHGARCRFAHKPEELVLKPCRYGERCFCVKKAGASSYANSNPKERVCDYSHPSESLASYCARTGIRR